MKKDIFLPGTPLQVLFVLLGVFKNNRPKILVIDLDTEPQIEMTVEEKLEFVAKRILREHRKAFEELAK